MFWKVQSAEVMPIIFNFWPLTNCETYVRKNINNKVISTKEKLDNSPWVGKNNKTDIKISFDNDNNIQGSDSNNCNYYGRLSPLNNFVYNVEIEIASCGTSDGFYYGMGYSYNNGSKKSLDITAIGNSFSLLINLTN